MQTITAAVLHDSQGEFSLEQVELDEPRANEILVRIEASGVCHTDAWAKEQIPVPSVLGHEGVGIVEKTGTGVSRVKPGDRVIISYPWCGECLTCRDNRPYACEQFIPICFGGTRMDGSEHDLPGWNPVDRRIFPAILLCQPRHNTGKQRSPGQ